MKFLNFTFIFKWHKRIAVLVAIPVIFWALSGLAHPLMSNWLKPEIKNKWIITPSIPKNIERYNVDSLFHENSISNIKNLRVINMDSSWYYQVVLSTHDVQYFEIQSGRQLPNGDKLYAHYLASKFVGDSKLDFSAHMIQEKFTSQYRYVNRFLPVHRISFNVKGMNSVDNVYIQTTSEKLASFDTPLKRFYLDFFNLFHNWGFLNFFDSLRIFIIVCIMLLSLFVSLTGIFIFFKLRKKKRKGLTKWHTYTGLTFSLFALLFAISASTQALSKTVSIAAKEKYNYNIPTSQLHGLDTIITSTLAKFDNTKQIGLFNWSNSVLLQHFTSNRGKKSINVIPLETPHLYQSDEELAKSLALYYSGLQTKDIIETKLIQKFDHEYGFINKRLPVWKVSMNTADGQSYFIDTSTGKLAKASNNITRTTGWIFSYLHKYHFLGPLLSRDIRDIWTILLVSGIILTNILGLLMFYKRKYTHLKTK